MGSRPKTAGVIGWPVGHSLSPVIHRIWAEREGIDAVYLKVAVEPGRDALKRAVAGLRAAGFAGVNVTAPHKVHALEIADAASAAAKAAGAANMLSFQRDGLYADNSDVAGFQAALLEAFPPPRSGGVGDPGLRPGEPEGAHLQAAGDLRSPLRPLRGHLPRFAGEETPPIITAIGRAVVLGAGGAARSVILALKAMGAGEIVAINRTAEKARDIARHFKTAAADWAGRDAALAGADIVVNATSLGMAGMPPLDLSLDALPPTALVADIVYSPLETELLRSARRRGLRTCDGLSMLMHQAVVGYRLWLGGAAAVDSDLRTRIEDMARGTKMKVVGLTGSIGMGKSTVAEMFRDLGIPVWCADDAVHRLYRKGGAAVAPLAEQFPEAVIDGAVDRDRLSALVIGDAQRLAALESLVHPLVGIDRQSFIEKARADKAALVILDIPLLFESGYETGFDAVIVVSAPPEIQRARVLARPGMSETKFAAILKKQTSDAAKRARADYVIDTGRSLGDTRREIAALAAILRRGAAAGPGQALDADQIAAPRR